MGDSPGGLSAEARDKLICDFEGCGFAVFRIEEDRAAFDTLTQYIRENSIATYTQVDREEGIVTLTKRPLGSLELF